jgi:coenzyme F420-reducing hydrogenase beta subunit
MECYAAYAKDERIRKSGSSGGLFPIIAMHCLSKGWIIYASVYDDDLNVVFNRIDNETELIKSFTSKYLQSRVGDIFKNIEHDLKDGKKVLFCGSPCQASGVKKYLETKRVSFEALLVIDFICHGVPSEDVFHRSMYSYKDTKCVSLNMRNKDNGWNYGMYSWKMLFSDGEEKIVSQSKVPYMKGFLSNIYLRPSCYECVAKKNSGSDITLGDFWGISEVNSSIDTKNGVSCVIVKTELGRKIFSEVSGNVETIKVSYKDIFAGNPSLEKSVSVPAYRKKFFKIFNSDSNVDVNSLILSITSRSFKNRVINKIYSKLPQKKLSAKGIIEKGERTIFLTKGECCGCSSCFAACPKDSIKMKKDKEGFFYPIINVQKCINCGICVNACPLK